ncbi:DUF445 domain-containing protein [Akkermansiaceae bacterium]|nr:DUF445 domain-containing protein [Akkermansiaceae bacterium]
MILDSLNSLDSHGKPAAIKNEKLIRVRVIATGILVLMAALYVMARSYESQFPALQWLRAFAEAGMVGGLADWFAVTALFRHPLGLKIPHTAVIPREKDRIGKSFAEFIHSNFLTAERICKQARDLQIVYRMAQWMAQPTKADQLARQTLSAVPVALDAMEKYDAHRLVTDKFVEQLRTIRPDEMSSKLISWLLRDDRYRRILAPLLVQLANALSANKESIDGAARSNAPLQKVPFLGKLSGTLAEVMSDRATGNIEESLLAASESVEAPLWDTIGDQLMSLQTHLETNDELRDQLEGMRDQWLGDEKSAELAVRLWQQVRSSLDQDLAGDDPKTVHYLAGMITSLGIAVEGDAELAENIESVLLEGVSDILTKHGDHLQTMIRTTIEEWDADTLMEKLENQVGSDLQFIRINGTLIGGLVGLALHAVGKLIWH